jgi:hypothetical protein
MHLPINVKSPNNIIKWQMGFNSAFKGVFPFALHYVPATVEVRVAGTVELTVFTAALAKLRKATTGCVMSVSHSAPTEQLGFPPDGFS